MNRKVLETSNIIKYFHDPVTVKVLKDITFSITEGEFVSIVGKSGCGKSTLLYILSTMDTDYEGELRLDRELMGKKSREDLAVVRNEKIGFVFQFHYLLPEFDVLQNVMLPGLKLNKLSKEEVETNAMKHLTSLGLSDVARRKASQLSGGEKQRVAIARALINNPLIIMCDEPTGNLDKKNSEVVFEIFANLKQLGQTLLVVTHDNDFAGRTERIIEMEDGKIIEDRLTC
jgi:lipoprotein-releasing system ATP-binding protein